MPQAVCQHGDSEWKLVVSKKRWWKAAALCKQEWSCDLAAYREGEVLAATAAKSLEVCFTFDSSCRPETRIDSGKSDSASSTVYCSKLQGQANAYHGTIRDSFDKVQHVVQWKDCLVTATAVVWSCHKWCCKGGLCLQKL